MNKITIAYAPDTNSVPLTLASMASVLKNAKKSDDITFVIMYSVLNEKYLQMFDNLQAIKNYELKLLKIDENIFDGFPLPDTGTMETWFRCLLADVLPDEERVLYLDSDTIVRNSLNDLFKTELDDCLLGVVEDVLDSKENSERLGLQDGFYFNAGVLLINLKTWRKTDFFSSLKTTIMTDNRIMNDQDALNKACDCHKYRLMPKYNYMHVWWRKNIPDYDEKYLKEFAKAEENPTIVHFTGVKPYVTSCKNKFCAEFTEYATLVPAYEALQKEIGIKKNGKICEKKPWYKRLLKK